MTEIIEGNKLIAEFDGKEVSEDNNYHMKHFDNKNLFFSSHLKYHESWDWLMPVVNKIKESYQGEKLHIESCKLYDNIEAMLKEVNIKLVHAEVVKFIKWLNAQTN